MVSDVVLFALVVSALLDFRNFRSSATTTSKSTMRPAHFMGGDDGQQGQESQESDKGTHCES